MNSVVCIAATRESDENRFDRSTFLGISLSRIPNGLRPQKWVANIDTKGKGLPEIYNAALDDAGLNADTLVFIHDDVFVHDWFLSRRLTDALERFDVVGVAGSKNPQLRHPSWIKEFDEALLPRGTQAGLQSSGAVGHFDHACPSISWYGETPAECKLLDGLLLAVNKKRLNDAGVRFDEQFRFHCYDIDFCRSAAEKNLRIGTWPIAVTHRSGGNFDSQEFRVSARKYLQKWEGR